MSEDVFFFDTYAFFEIIRGNKDYEKYKEVMALTSIFNIAELSYCLRKEFDKKIADKYTDRYSLFMIDATANDIKDAVDIKIKNKKMSMPDVVGYVLAKRLKIRFLTGDEHFRSLPNVEFIK